MLELSTFFAISTTVFLITYFVGFFISIPFIGEKIIPAPILFFFKLALGYIVIPVVCALWYTGGYTVLSGVLLLFFIILLLNESEWVFPKGVIKKEAKYLFIGCAILFVLMLFQAWRYGFFDKVYYHAFMQDNGIYVTVAEYLKITGVETPSPWYQLMDVSNDGVAKMYHFEDFWFFAFVLEFLPEKPLDLFNYVLSPVLGALQFFGGLAIIIELKRKSVIDWLDYFCSIGFVVFVMYVPLDFASWTSVLHMNVMAYPKVAAIPILVPFILLVGNYNLKYLGALAIVFILISDPLFLPVLFGAGLVYYAFLFLQKRKQEELINIGLLFFSAGWFFVFHFFFGSFGNSSDFISEASQESYLFGFFKKLAASVLRHLLFFFPVYLTVFYLVFFQKSRLATFEKKLLGFILLLLAAGAFIRALMHRSFESFQFDLSLQTTMGALLIISCFFMLRQLELKDKSEIIIRNILMVMLFSQLVYGVFASNFFMLNRFELNVEKKFVGQVENELGHKNKIGAAIINRSKYTEEGFDLTASLEADPRICFHCNFLKHIGAGYWANQINVPAIIEELENKERATALQLSPFFLYIQKLKKEGRYTGYEDAQISYLRNYNIDFIVVEKGADVPDAILNMVEKELIDDYSQTKILILKNR